MSIGDQFPLSRRFIVERCSGAKLDPFSNEDKVETNFASTRIPHSNRELIAADIYMRSRYAVSILD